MRYCEAFMSLSPVDVVKKFWELMATNDFQSVGSVLSDEFVLDWPQSNERIRGRQNFAQMNLEYPAHGRWQFTIHRIVGNDREAVSDVSVTDGVQHARAISFFTVTDDQIIKMVEFWPDPFSAAANRAHLVEKLMPDTL
jgi:SnoaL-like domain